MTHPRDSFTRNEKISSSLTRKGVEKSLECPHIGFARIAGAVLSFRTHAIRSFLHKAVPSSKRCGSTIFNSLELEKMQIRPLHDRVIVKRLEVERTTLGGIILPDTAGEKPDQGEVIAVGPGKRDEAGKLIPMDVQVGDRVLFGKYSGQTVKVDGQELLVMREDDIMGVIA
jgi:chaperonin GroES